MSGASLFVHLDGSLKLPSCLLLVAAPAIATGYWLVGIILIVVGLVVALFTAVEEQKDDGARIDEKYEHMLAFEIVDTIKSLGTTKTENRATIRLETAAGFGALLKQCLREQKVRKRNQTENGRFCLYEIHELELLCQEALYWALQQWRTQLDDELLLSVFSLFPLVASDSKVRERHLHEANRYGLNEPIEALQGSLERAKDINEPEEATERRSAEVQRKGCLFLGALADGDTNMATKIVDEGGLEHVIDVLDWYRFHEEIANWATWAIFILCYDHHGNKAELVRLGGVQILCQAMKNVPSSKEVARHAIATLFDVLRIESDKPKEVLKIREIALASGMHDAVTHAMMEFNDSIEIMMMGQEMLLATGYTDEIPQYRSLGREN